MKHILMIFSLFLLGTPLAYAGPDYKVEIIIFAQTDDQAFFSEHWPLQDGLQGNTSPEEAKEQTGAFRLLPTSDFTLRQAEKLLASSPRYEILSHMAWQQPGLAEDKALNMPVSGGKDYRDSYPERMESRWEVNDQGAIIEVPGPKTLNELDGSVKLVLGRYLHIYTDLIYRKPVIVERLDEETQELTETRTLFDIPIQSHRRMRSRELHYIDHPMAGILIEVTPLETEKEPS
jgi:hypothetical protein